MIEILRLFAAGVKKNYKAALVLQGSALLIVLAYYFIPQWGVLLDQLGDIKEKGKALFPAISSLFFGGLIPYLIFLASGQIKREHRISHLLFYTLFWAWKGVEVNYLYQLQGFFFGVDPTVWVVIKKMFVDQFIYGPIWAAPTMTLFYLWKESDFSLTKMKAALRDIGLFQRILPVFISNITVWVPAVCIIYMLPLNLQLPLSNIVLCFWALILHFLSKDNPES